MNKHIDKNKLHSKSFKISAHNIKGNMTIITTLHCKYDNTNLNDECKKVTGLVNKYVYQMVTKHTTDNNFYLSVNGK